jgi:hypothetical protein
MATQKRPVRKAPAKGKAKAKAAPRKKAPVREPVELTLRQRAQQGVNVYLGLWGVGYDLLQENLEFARKGNKLRMKQLEKRGLTVRKQLRRNLDKFEVREMDQMFDGVREPLDKLQKRLEELAKGVKPKEKVARAA